MKPSKTQITWPEIRMRTSDTSRFIFSFMMLDTLYMKLNFKNLKFKWPHRFPCLFVSCQSESLVVCDVDEDLVKKLREFRFRKETNNAAIVSEYQQQILRFVDFIDVVFKVKQESVWWCKEYRYYSANWHWCFSFVVSKNP